MVYISGAINAQVACRYMHDRKFKGTLHGYFKTAYGWAWWLGMLLVGNIFSFVIAEVVPFFSSLRESLGQTSSLASRRVDLLPRHCTLCSTSRNHLGIVYQWL